MTRVIAHSKSRELTREELEKVSGGVAVFTGSKVKSGNPKVLESTDPGQDAGGGTGQDDSFFNP